MARAKDPYLIMRPRGMVHETPKKLLPYLETVRLASEWKSLGFSVELDEFGFPKVTKKCDYDFDTVRTPDEEIAEAIKTGKKAVRHPLIVFDYVAEGVELDEFISLPDDVRYFCEGNLLRLNGKASDALPLLEKAAEFNPSEVRYREIYYPLRLELGDLKSIDEEFKYFHNDIDTVVHTGRVDEWVKALIKAGEFNRARELLRNVDVSLSQLESGSMVARRYTKQSRDWYQYKRQQFAKQAEKLFARIDKAEKKNSSPNKALQPTSSLTRRRG